MILKEINLSILPKTSEELQFRDEVRCICNFYERNMPKVVSDFWKVDILCVDQITDQRYKNLLGVLEFQIEFDFPTYWKSSKLEKKKIILEAVSSGIQKACEKYRWDYSPFLDIYNKFVDLDYVNNWIWKKPKKNKSRKLSAEVHCHHDLLKFEIFIVITNDQGNILKNEKVLSITPNEFVFVKYFGTLKWDDSNQISLYSKDKNSKLSVIVEQG